MTKFLVKWNLVCWWDLLDVPLSSYFFYLIHWMFKGESLLTWFSCSKRKKKKENVGFYLDIYRPMFFKLGRMIETTKLYILISVWMTLTFSSHSCVVTQNSGDPFLTNLTHSFLGNWKTIFLWILGVWLGCFKEISLQKVRIFTPEIWHIITDGLNKLGINSPSSHSAVPFLWLKE